MVSPDPRRLWLVLPVALALAPHIAYLPGWVSAAAGLCLLWRLAPAWRRDAPLQRLLRAVLALAGVAGVLLHFRTLLGPQAGLSLLVLMASLKLVEADGRRDQTVMVLAGYFLLLSSLIHDQTLAGSAWLLFAATVLTASLVAAQGSGPPRLARSLRLGATLVVQAVPLALLFFLLFPRLPSPIGGLVHAPQARTGLSDSMSPGSVSQLSLSDAIAFRVDFQTPGIDGRKLYWRGPVLWDYDGRTWQRGGLTGERGHAEGHGDPIDYTVTLEPHDKPWLLVAGLTGSVPVAGAFHTADMEWLSDKPIQERARYSVSAWLRYRLEPDLAPWRKRRALTLPDGYNPRALDLGRRWAAANAAPQALVQRALDHFREEAFHYTLSPPRLGRDAIDDFLFDSRRGFCEHYAAAFVTLMRAAGVPARVVTGYQGGERNPLGDYWVVRQRDAHAWAEVWLDGQGWQSIDPTAAVAPDRVERGLLDALPIGERPLLDLPAAWLAPLHQGWDYVNTAWNRWVLGYDFERQRRLLERISPRLADYRGMVWGMLIGAAAILGILSLLVFRSLRPRPRDAATRAYDRFCARLGGIGLPRATAEGPADFAARAARARPDLAAAIHAISRLYIDLRYGHAPSTGLAELRRRIRSFRPSLSAGTSARSARGPRSTAGRRPGSTGGAGPR